jgi:hypothetical protein
MLRSYSVNRLIALPRLDAVSTARLITELHTAAEALPALPASIEPDLDELLTAHDALQIRLGKRVSGEDRKPQVREADQAEDNAFAALADWLRSWMRLPEARYPEVAMARTVHDTLFPDGLGFLNLPVADEWQEAETRLQVMKEKGLDAIVEKLGGQRFLDELHAAHAAYGEALGITVVKKKLPPLREAFDAATDALRSYVLRVAALVRKEEPESAALAERLLLPLLAYKNKPAKHKEKEKDGPASPVESAATEGPPPAVDAPAGRDEAQDGGEVSQVGGAPRLRSQDLARSVGS